MLLPYQFKQNLIIRYNCRHGLNVLINANSLSFIAHLFGFVKPLTSALFLARLLLVPSYFFELRFIRFKTPLTVNTYKVLPKQQSLNYRLARNTIKVFYLKNRYIAHLAWTFYFLLPHINLCSLYPVKHFFFMQTSPHYFIDFWIK